MEDVCYTQEAALERAIQIEAKRFEGFKSGYFMARDRVVKDLIRDLALDALKHKYTLEKAFFEDIVHLHDTGGKEGPSMKFSLLFEERPLKADASEQEVMIYAIHETKHAVDFYVSMAQQCMSAPMGEMFRGLAEDEKGHLARLEEFYESRFMRDM